MGVVCGVHGDGSVVRELEERRFSAASTMKNRSGASNPRATTVEERRFSAALGERNDASFSPRDPSRRGTAEGDCPPHEPLGALRHFRHGVVHATLHLIH